MLYNHYHIQACKYTYKYKFWGATILLPLKKNFMIEIPTSANKQNESSSQTSPHLSKGSIPLFLRVQHGVFRDIKAR